MIFIERLMWNDLNIAHIARHKVTPKEVEEVCHNNPQVEKGYSGRIRFVGVTNQGRMLAVVLAPKPADAYLPVTARPASIKERRRYRQERGGEL